MDQESKRGQLGCNPGDICSLYLGAGSVYDEKTDERFWCIGCGAEKVGDDRNDSCVSGLSSLVDELLAS